MVLASISGSVDRAFTVFFAWLPALVGAIVVLLIGYVIAKIVAGLVARVTQRAGLDRALHNGPGGTTIHKIAAHPSRLLGAIVFWAVLLSAVSLAASVLHIKALTAFVGAVSGYLPNVIAALAIFIIAGLIATAVASLASRVMGDTGLRPRGFHGHSDPRDDDRNIHDPRPAEDRSQHRCDHLRRDPRRNRARLRSRVRTRRT